MSNIYLFELDSVRNSKREIEIAQKRLYRELLVNGNNVFITFNQLSDSQFFLTMLNSDEHYEMLLKMFRHGFIKASIYKSVVTNDKGEKEEVRTASKYIQDALKKAMSNKKEDYHFSGMPISRKDPYLLNEVRIALKNSDPELITDDIKKLNEFKTLDFNNDSEVRKFIRKQGSDFIKKAYRSYKLKTISITKAIDNDIERLTSFYKYVHLILLISRQKIAYSSSKNATAKTNLESNINRAVEIFTVDKCKYDDKYFKRIYVEAIKDIDANRKEKRKNRSDWYKGFDESTGVNRNVLALEEMIIDVCYNYTCQFSIAEIDSSELIENEDEFCEEYFDVLYSYYLDYKNKIHTVHSIEEKMDKSLKPIPNYEWNVVYEIKKDVIEHCDNKQENLDKPWHKLVRRTQLFNAIAGAASTVAIFVIFNLVFDAFTGVFDNLSIPSGVVYVLVAILETLIFGYLSSKLSEIFKIVDILDIVKTLKTKLHRYKVYIKERKLANEELYF